MPEASGSPSGGLFRWLPATLGPRSVAFRVVGFSTIWAVVALVVVSTFISALYRQASVSGFESLLRAHLFNLVGAVTADEDGALTGSPNLGDLRFTEPGSGWYWTVEPASPSVTGPLYSLNLIQTIPAPPVSEVPFDRDFQRRYRTTGPAGEELEVVESEYRLGRADRLAHYRVMGNVTALEAEIAAFDRQLFIYLLAFGVGMIVINSIAILLGLRPLTRVREALAQIRQGTAQRLDGRFPAEIEPLANETNALIENNRRIVERSRTQVGNLAHSLKTPLAVLINEGRALGGDKGRLISEQAQAMQGQVEHYLQRARVAAQRDSVVYRTPVNPLVERMARVMQKLNPATRLELVPMQEDLLFGGESEDLEELLGNLLENAMKWAKSKVRLRAAPAPADQQGAAMFELVIEDDGPGIPEDKAREALKRGRRLDETKPGTGLGLAIVTDLVKEYGGELALRRSALGGLEVAIRLRRVD